LGVIDKVNTNTLRENHVLLSVHLGPRFSDWTIQHVHLTTKPEKKNTYPSNYKNVPLHHTTENMYLFTKLQYMCTYLTNYRNMYLSIKLHTLCTYLQSYRPSVPTHRTTQQHNSLFTVTSLCIPIMTISSKLIIGTIWDQSNSQSLVLY